jgi:hypothetical protein
MSVTVTKAFAGCRDGEVIPRRFEVGEELTGDLARVALKQGWAYDDEKSSRRAPKSGKGVVDTETSGD